MKPYMRSVTAIFSSIMNEKKDDAIESSDRISLIKFSRRLHRTFSLVQKDSNFTQLKNQMDKLSQLDKMVDEFNDDDEDEYEEGHHLGYLPSSLKEIILEFEKHKLIKKYNNDVSGEPGVDAPARLQQ